MIERLFVDPAGDFGSDSEALVPFVNDDRPAGLANRCEDRVLVKRHDRPRIDHLGTAGEQEHGVAMLTTVYGNAMRNAGGGGAANKKKPNG